LIRCDASLSGIGAVLSQQRHDDQEQPLSFASKAFAPHEQKWSVIEWEAAYGIVWALKHFRPFIYGYPVIIKSDHRPLQWLLSSRTLNDKLMRWSLVISDYNILDIEYIPGKDNVVADALSRMYINTFTGCTIEKSEILLAQQHDVELQQYFSMNSETMTKRGYCLNNAGELCRSIRGQLRPMIPKALRLQVLHSIHGEPLVGHHGITKTKERLQERYYWHGMNIDVEQFIHNCLPCVTRKSGKKLKTKLQPIHTERPLQLIGSDILGPLRKTKQGYKYIITLTDLFTKLTEAVPIKDTTTGQRRERLLMNFYPVMVLRNVC